LFPRFDGLEGMDAAAGGIHLRAQGPVARTGGQAEAAVHTWVSLCGTHCAYGSTRERHQSTTDLRWKTSGLVDSMSSLLAGDHLFFSNLPPSRPIYIYWHTWSGSDKQRYSYIVARQWESLVLSKLAHYVTRVCMSLPEDHNEHLPDTLLNSTKVDFQYFSTPVHEGFTLGRMKHDADEGEDS